MENFNNLGLPQQILQALAKMQFTKPTPIQSAALPPALEGRDILGTAQTGTGKTAAFAIPLIAWLMEERHGTALVVAPTRELAAQIVQEMHKFLGFAPFIKTALLIGGESMSRQLQQLRPRPRVIIGTPGRINDHLQQRSLDLRATGFLVLDETDKMLDMGFEVQIDRIVQHLPRQRQTLLFSATLPPHIVKLAQKYLHNPQRISIGETNRPAERIKQELIQLQHAEKYEALVAQLRQRKGSVLVFVKTKRGADRIAKKLNAANLGAQAIHGNLNQNQRTRAIQAFRDKRARVMIATDIAARGLDIPHIEHVINYDLPQCPEDYIHRIGRTARAGATGEAVCFLTPEDRDQWREIHFLMNPSEKPARNEHRRPQPQQNRNAQPRRRDNDRNRMNGGHSQQRQQPQQSRRGNDWEKGRECRTDDACGASRKPRRRRFRKQRQENRQFAA